MIDQHRELAEQPMVRAGRKASPIEEPGEVVP
jgi:hypothetical protein